MRALWIVALVAGVGCASTPPPESPPESPSVPEAEAPSASPADAVDLTRGKRIETHGVEIMLRGTKTEHHPDAPTVMRVELDVRKAGERQDITVEREESGEPRFVEVFDLQVGLETVDASLRPSTARILIRQ